MLLQRVVEWIQRVVFRVEPFSKETVQNNSSKEAEADVLKRITKTQQTLVQIGDKTYVADTGIIWMRGQNNSLGSTSRTGETSIPYLYEQANVLNTILNNVDKL